LSRAPGSCCARRGSRRPACKSAHASETGGWRTQAVDPVRVSHHRQDDPARPGTESTSSGVGHHMGRRRMLTAAVILICSACAELETPSAPQASRPPAAEPSTQASAAALCTDKNYPGPWTACPEAAAVRRVIERSGLEVFFDQGAAWFATDRSTTSFSVSVSGPPSKPVPAWMGPVVQTVDGVDVHSDGIWIAWRSRRTPGISQPKALHK
jgi:hypothetical protein